MGRPKAEINEEVVKALAFAGCPNTEIADYVGIHESRIRRRFADILAKARADRRKRLREMQWESAGKGNVAMLIWLGKQDLGQSEKVETHGDQTIIIKEKILDTSPVIENRINGSTESIGPVGAN
jgi:hypothetical protein